MINKKFEDMTEEEMIAEANAIKEEVKKINENTRYNVDEFGFVEFV
jgi:hypothetical protein